MGAPIGFHSQAAAQAWMAAPADAQDQNPVDAVAYRAIEDRQVERGRAQSRCYVFFQCITGTYLSGALFLGSYASNGAPVAPILGMLSGMCLATSIACCYSYTSSR